MEQQFNTDTKDYIKGVFKLTNLDSLLPETNLADSNSERIAVAISEAIFHSEGDIHPEHLSVELQFFNTLQDVVTIETKFKSTDGEYKSISLSYRMNTNITEE